MEDKRLGLDVATDPRLFAFATINHLDLLTPVLNIQVSENNI